MNKGFGNKNESWIRHKKDIKNVKYLRSIIGMISLMIIQIML